MTITRSAVVPGWIVTTGPVTVRVAPRTVAVGAVLAIILLAAALVTLTSGTLDLSPGEVVAALAGQGDDRAVRTVQGRRLPRLLTALLVGGALGAGGAVFQSLSRNALASPDVIGLTSGASTGAVVQLVLLDGGMLATALSAVGGGLLTALVVYILARRDGTSGGMRLVLVGIGIGAVCSAITWLLLVRAELDQAVTAQQWLAGSLLGRGWPHVWSIGGAVVVLVPALVVVARRLTLMEMGDDLAAGLGVRVERTRLLGVVLGVVLTGAAVAATGPLAFVALAAPQVVRRLTRQTGVPVGGAFLVGGTLLVLADLLAQNVDLGLRTPVGTVTALLGGLYLIWLLARRA
ncbi:transport system permease protein [Xylanimonas cellulosilytica DSM 15894]|uniref:Transport system permease protein n=1 Tax=Xylanimonas cellulosilytica (strain DSM 15894 / JCM 12276 / CECT 5975 / KCTC 9989 / LMG 20990 / NBRC 107835 / XIL07) TaxID=446471 RepID=D1BRY8_XYLCX|nr:iron chelate uptake ABC transporter family permease subunit [Xylanimonas cellulosilytica]ACZ30480.1 transport system permease protein [Xylanimonas cellulosilytica DSM 15894]